MMLRSVLPAILLSAVLLLPKGAESSDVQLLESNPGRVSFSVEFGEPAWNEVTDQGTPYRYPSWSTLSTAASIGSPALPHRYVTVAIPWGSRVSVAYAFQDSRSEAGVRFPPERGPVPQPQDVFPRREIDTLPWGPWQEGEAYRTSVAVPPVEVVDTGILRGVSVAKVRVSPVTWSPQTQRLTWAHSVEVTLTLSGGTPGRSASSRPDPVFDVLLEQTLVNPRSAKQWREPAREPRSREPASKEEAALPPHWYDGASQWIKVAVSENGIYEIRGSDLSALGIELAGLDPSTLRMFSGPLMEEFRWSDSDLVWLQVAQTTGFSDGFQEAVNPEDGRTGMNEVSIVLDLGEDGTFDEEDALRFYALGPDNWLSRYGEESPEYHEHAWASTTVYWLGLETEFPWAPKRIESVEAIPQGPDIRSTQPARVHFEENLVHDPSMFDRGARWERYFWRRLRKSVGAEEDLPLPGFVPGTNIDARVRLWGASNPIGTGTASFHNARLDLNGVTEVASWNLDYDLYDVTFTDVPGQDVSVLEIEVAGDFPEFPTRVDLIHLAWAEVFYERTLTAEGSELEFEFDDVGDGLRVSDLPSGEVWIWDVTNFREPVSIQGSRTGNEVSFVPSHASGVIHVVPVDSFLRPASLALDQRPDRWLRDTSEPLDYVIVTHRRFESQAQALADHRRTHLDGITENREARVRVVCVDDIYDEFAWGMPDPTSIRYFLEYAFRYYGDPADDRLTYCLFLGDTTTDPRNYEGYGTENLVPSWMFNFGSISFLAFGSIQYVSDDLYVRLDGPRDWVPDLASGRISVSTEEEANRVIYDKVIGSETQADLGPWRNKAILVADDVCQAFDEDRNLWGQHMDQTEDVDQRIPLVFDRDKVYLFEYGEECIYPTKPEAKRDLLQSWSEGAWLVNYIGHGASLVLADEHVLDIEDVPALGNTNRLSLFTAFSCSVGKFARPSVTGIGETVLQGAAGGGMAAIAATYLTPSGGNVRLNLEFIDNLFSQGASNPVPIGAALWASKITTSAAVAEKYVLLGDPGSRVNVPTDALDLSGVSKIVRGQTEGLMVRHPDYSGDGLVDVVVQDARELRDKDENGDPIPKLPDGYFRNPSTLFHGQSRLGSDSTRVQYVTPVTLREGTDGRIRAYAWGNGWDAAGVLAPLTAGGQTQSPSDSLGPVVEVEVPGGFAVPGDELALTLEDPAGIDVSQLFEFRGILVRIRDLDGRTLARSNITESFQYDLGSYTRGQALYPVPDLEPGSYELVISSFDNYANKGETILPLGIVEPGAPPSLGQVYAYPNPMEAETTLGFTLDRPGRVEFKIFSVRGRLVLEDEVSGVTGRNGWSWQGVDSLGDPVANGVYLLQLVLRDESGNSVTRHLERLVVYR